MGAMRLACGSVVVATLAGLAAAHVSERQGWAVLARQSGWPRPPSIDTAARSPPALPESDAGVPRFHAGPDGGTLTLSPDRYGQYHAELEVEGHRVPVLIDTGASVVALSYEAAARLGYFPAPADFTMRIGTANGIARGAPIEIAELHVGPIVARRVRAIVSERGALTSDALLGMSFLRELSGFSVEGGRLVLRQ